MQGAVLKRCGLKWLTVFCFLFVTTVRQVAAQVCTGSLGDPVVKITFGAGTATHAGALASGTTNYTYTSADFPNDGSYTVENTTNTPNTWWTTTDHTGDTGGYMMVVNASISKTDYFYKSTVTGLCPGTTFEFGAWVVNLLRSQDISPPNITFNIYRPDGTTLIKSLSTGTIPLTTDGPHWKQYAIQFTMPSDISSVVIVMTNNSNGGAPANDVAIDDITFRPCGPTMISSFSSSSNIVTANTCTASNQTYTLTSDVSTGYTNPAYRWQVNSGSGWTDIAGAIDKTYTLTQPSVAGTYQYRLVSAEAGNIGATSCQVASNILSLTVNSTPTASFTAASTPCLGSATSFTDQSTAPGSSVTSWSWDFGDGQTSTLQNPQHTYAAAGSYPVTLTIKTAAGCTATSPAATVHIDAQTVAEFMASSPNCATKPVIFTDSSTPANGTIAKWTWHYDDGSADEVLTTNQPHTHTYTIAGTYNVTLQTTTQNGCISNVTTHQVVVNPLPVADFSMPDVCLDDSKAQFTDKSTIADGSEPGFTYAWNFGDGNATSANPNTSSEKNPQHKYSQAGNYTVTLNVTSASGCVSATKTQTFTVNGANPKAAFTVDNSSNLCSSDPVVFTNTSTVDFGNITKVIFYYDADNASTDSTVYYRSQNQIPADNRFYHSYGRFTDPLTKSYHVVMLAYSGNKCYNSAETNITIHANPTVDVTPLAPLCNQDAAMQFITNTHGFSGTGTFSGTGVSSNGLFDPKQSGTGIFNINYIFTATNGCQYSTSVPVTVYPNPTVSASAELTVLEGGQTTIKASAAGDGLTYKWTPSTGLSADNELQPTVSSLTDDTQYTLTVTNANGCTALATVIVKVLKAPLVPNTFTPNSDGVNDTWDIKYLDSYPNCTVDVFNRYGMKVFASTGYSSPWDGKLNGSPLPSGVYYYIINPKNGRSQLSGSLTIIR